MTEPQFEALVERLSVRARQHPTAYRLEVLGLALLAYLYVFLLVIGALAMSAVVLVLGVLKPIILLKGLKIIWLPVWFAWSVLRALWVRFPKPQGRELQAHEAPALFAEIESIREAIKGPKPHHVLITDDYNAAVVQQPRLGLIGGSSNYLILGLPIMAALSVDQMRAVIAHEFGHLGAGDSRMTGRIYHMRMTWGRLQAQFAQRGGFFFKRFFAWFGPTFNAYSFVLARSQEYAADAAAARLVGAGPAAEALVLANLGGAYQDEQIWTPLWDRSRHEVEPATPPFAQLLTRGRRYDSWPEAEARLGQSMQRQTDWSDTHPSLNDRLAALGRQAFVPPAQGPSAADVFLGNTAVTLAKELDAQWQARIAERWRERFEKTQAEREELARLEAEAESGPLPRDADWSRAQLIESLRDGATARPFYESHLDRFPDSQAARYAIGRLQLAANDEAGIAMIDEVMAADGEAIKPGAALIFAYLMARDRKDEAAKYKDAWNARNQLEQAAEAERSSFSAADDYDSHDLADDAVARLRTASATLAWLDKIWLVRKRVQHFPDRPAYLMLAKPRWYKSIKRDRGVAEVRKALNLADGVTVSVYDKNLKALFKKATRAPGCQIYRA